MIRLPKLSDNENCIVHQDYASLTDIFLQGVILCLFEEREDGFHKAFRLLRSSYEDYVDDQLLKGKLDKLLQRLNNGNISAWKNLLLMANKTDAPIGEIVVQICPPKIRDRYEQRAA